MIDFQAEEKEFANIIAKFEEDLKSIRTGRAHASFLESVMVNVYGSMMSLEHVATLSTPDARSILIAPWDKSSMPAIEQAIIKANLGVSPIADKDRIRIQLPALTEERRLELVKILKKKAEETKISIRRRRDEIWKTIQDEEKSKQISENQKFSQKEKMEKMVSIQNKKIENLVDKKEKEIMEI